jgi:hypothetical protein
LLVTADAASTGLMRDVAVRCIYLYGRIASFGMFTSL